MREPTPIPWLGGAVVGFAKDPDGYLVELLQRGRAVELLQWPHVTDF